MGGGWRKSETKRERGSGKKRRGEEREEKRRYEMKEMTVKAR